MLTAGSSLAKIEVGKARTPTENAASARLNPASVRLGGRVVLTADCEILTISSSPAVFCGGGDIGLPERLPQCMKDRIRISNPWKESQLLSSLDCGHYKAKSVVATKC